MKTAEKYYTFKCETYSGDEINICVRAESEKAAVNKLSSYKVSHGELHYYKLIEISEAGTEKYYSSSNNALALLIALTGAAMGKSITSQYFKNDQRKIESALNAETLHLIREV